MTRLFWPLALALCSSTALPAAEPDLRIADFEGKDYGDWKVTGEAFGPGPAQGTLPGQMHVSGFEGKGLINTYYQGDGTTGTLTSPPLSIQRKYINFLLGGGGNPGKTCINLLIDGKIARTATGPNTRPGGSEQLEWHAWDVSDLGGKTAVIEIVDQATGGWGHINIDHILQSDQRRGAEPAERELAVQRRYLHLPVKNGAPGRWIRLVVDGELAREFSIELADEEPDLWVFTDTSAWKGRSLKIEVDRLSFGSQGLSSIRQADDVPDAESMYREAYRPQFHFTTRRGWHNDPNGLVYYDGQYHLFYQHNPYGVRWGNMTWGQAVSTDLVHWNELADAIHPDKLGTIYSGSAVVDQNNTAGFQTGDEKVIVCIYTSAGSHARPPVPYTQSIAYSNDRGRSWAKYEGNPVLDHIVGSNRDPKVLWHEPTRQWVMALFLDKRQYALFTSPNLKAWKRLCDVPELGAGECPDFFELPVDGDKKNTRWVFWGGNGNYLIGTFDGRSFTMESGPHPSRFGANDYAAQTYSDIPPEDGRRIQISWMSGGKYPDMPFNQQMTVPRVLTLRTAPEGIRLFLEPVREIELLRDKGRAWNDVELAPGQNPLAELSGELFDIEAEIELGEARQVGFEIRGHKVEYSANDRQLTSLGKSVPLEPADGRIKLRILVDRTSVEVFANGGRVSMASCFLPDAENKSLGVYALGGPAKIASLGVWELKSIWSR